MVKIFIYIKGGSFFMKIIVLGAGKVGKTLIKHMSNEDHDIIVVDQNATKV